MKKLYSTSVNVISGRDGSGRSNDKHLDVKFAFPEELGGDGNGTNPEQLFAAAYASCFASTLSILAKGDGTPVTDVENTAAIDVLQGADGLLHLTVRFEIKAKGQEPGTIETLIEKTKHVCPYSRAVKDRIPTAIVLV